MPMLCSYPFQLLKNKLKLAAWHAFGTSSNDPALCRVNKGIKTSPKSGLQTRWGSTADARSSNNSIVNERGADCLDTVLFERGAWCFLIGEPP